MKEDRPSQSGDPNSRSWLERIGHALIGEIDDRDKLLDILREAQERNVISSDALSMIEGVMEVSEMQVRDVMVPRSQMVVIQRDTPLREMFPVVIESAHSRFPVIGDNRDDIEGVLLAKDLLPYMQNEEAAETFKMRDILRPVVFIPESKRLNVLLKDFRANRNHLAIVVDEYGGVAGLITIEDVLEQIVGDIEDEHDIEEEGMIYSHGDNVFTVKALTPIDEFNEYFNCEFSEDEFDTIGGLIMKGFGHMPQRGEMLEYHGFSFKVLRADHRRIYLLRVTRLNASDIQAS